MKKMLFAIFICCLFFGCSKTKNSKSGTSASLVTNCTVNLNVGGRVYHTTNHTEYSSTNLNYQWDGLNVYFGFPACAAQNLDGYYQVSIWDTAQGAMTSQPLLQFTVPAVNNLASYNSPDVSIYFIDTAYLGTGVVSATVTNNGHHTFSGTFNLQGLVASAYSSDSIPYSASGTFSNALSY